MNNKKEIEKKCKRVKLIISDVDGVLTDGGMYYTEKGEEMKKFNTKDGMGVEILNANNIKIVLMSRENSKIVEKRAEKIKVDLCLIGIKKKEEKLKEIIEKFEVKPEEVGYVGDDINDLEIMKLVGFTACPLDAIQEIKNEVDFVCNTKGGHGVLREITELILTVNRK